MNLSSISGVATRTLGKTLFTAKKFSPEILTAVGVVGVIAAGVLTAKATLKLESTVSEIEKDIAPHKELLVQVKAGNPVAISVKEIKRDLTKQYVAGGVKLAKLYWKPTTLGLVSIGCILGANHILRKRNVALIAAYKVLEESYSEYQRRVVEAIGEDKEREIRVTAPVVDAETGEKGVETLRAIKGVSPYAEIFDRSNKHWKSDPDLNLYFLTASQNIWNERLRGRGHVFLNEVLAYLGFEHTSAGAVTGWIFNAEDGDSKIDFGFNDFDNIRTGAQLDGTEGHIYLDFNVDGIIWDKI